MTDKINVSYLVHPETVIRIKAIKTFTGMTLSAIIDRAVYDYFEKMDLENDIDMGAIVNE